MYRLTRFVVLVVLVIAVATAYSARNHDTSAHGSIVDRALASMRNLEERTVGMAAIGVAQAKPMSSGATIAVGFSPGNAEQTVVQAIGTAHKSIDVAAYSFTSRPIATALLEAKGRGVDVRVVADKSQEGAKYTSVRFLANKGIPVRIDSRYAIMHNKFMVIDGRTLETGSFNYTRSAQMRNAENVLVLTNAPEAAAIYTREWSRLWDESQPYSAAAASGVGWHAQEDKSHRSREAQYDYD